MCSLSLNERGFTAANTISKNGKWSSYRICIKFFSQTNSFRITVVVLETEGSVRKIQKGYFFTTKKIKKSTPNLTSPYVQNLFGITLIKQTFEKNKSPRAALAKNNLRLIKIEIAHQPFTCYFVDLNYLLNLLKPKISL